MSTSERDWELLRGPERDLLGSPGRDRAVARWARTPIPVTLSTLAACVPLGCVLVLLGVLLDDPLGVGLGAASYLISVGSATCLLHFGHRIRTASRHRVSKRRGTSH